MSTDRQLVMPKLGLTMTEGAISEWSIKPGMHFVTGQTVFVVESDKAAVEFDAPADGVLHEILVPAGRTVPVGTEIGKWTLEGYVQHSAQPQQGAADLATAEPTPQSQVVPTTAAPADRGRHAATASAGKRIVATPLARRQAAARQIDLATVTGTGPHGRIVAADVMSVVQEAHQPADATASAPSAASVRLPCSTLVEPSTNQRTMAARVTASKQQIPHIYLSIDVDVGELLTLRQSLNVAPERPRTSITHLLMAGVVEALRCSPSMNRIWTDAGLQTLSSVDVGLAIDTPQGLMSPVVRNLEAQSFYGLVRSVDAVIERARTANLRSVDVQGGAITISNAGMHDVRYMSSIIVPGQSAILGVGSVQPCFRPDDQGRPVLRREMGLVLSADHRIHTGVSALKFLNQLKAILQRPLTLLTGA